MERTARVPAVRAPVRGPKRLLALRSDDRLVDLVRAGDAAAFEVLYERHVAGILGFCRHMLGSQEEAEDAVQQAFVSAHGSICRGSREIAFKPWLYTIARNRCLSILRARREQPGELPEISTAGLNEQVERRADLRELVHDLQRLPEQQRAALLLTELEDLSHAEVAEVMSREPQAMKGLVFRARSALAERRDARAADCGEIRVELASAKGGALRRGRLRYHLETCPGCVAYLDEVRRQRKLLGIALPVLPTLALKDGVMGGAGIGAGAAGAAGLGTSGGGVGLATAGGAGAAGAATAGGAAGLGGALLGGTAVKLAVAAAIVAGGAGVATEAARDSGDAPPAEPPSTLREGSGGAAGQGQAGADRANGGGPAARALERRRGARGAERRALGQRRADQRSGGRSAAGEPHGTALGRERGPAGRAGGPPAAGRQGNGVGTGGRPPAAGGTPRGGAVDSPAGARGGGIRPAAPGTTRSAPPRAPEATPPPAASGGVPPARADGTAGNPRLPLE